MMILVIIICVIIIYILPNERKNDIKRLNEIKHKYPDAFGLEYKLNDLNSIDDKELKRLSNITEREWKRRQDKEDSIKLLPKIKQNYSSDDTVEYLATTKRDKSDIVKYKKTKQERESSNLQNDKSIENLIKKVLDLTYNSKPEWTPLGDAEKLSEEEINSVNKVLIRRKDVNSKTDVKACFYMNNGKAKLFKIYPECDAIRYKDGTIIDVYSVNLQEYIDAGNNKRVFCECKEVIMEQNTDYSDKINKAQCDMSFKTIRKYSSEAFLKLTTRQQDIIFGKISHGVAELENDKQLSAYMYSYGKMHEAKLNKAYNNLSIDIRSEEQIDIIDYGCGQGLGCICYNDFLKTKQIQQNVRRIILIEPSKIALARAALNVSVVFPNSRITTINKGFDELTSDDLYTDSDIPTLHILSNVLDMGSSLDSDGFYDLKSFSELIAESVDGKNEFVCVAPLFDYAPKDEKIDDFIDYAGIEKYYETDRGKGEFVEGKDWTCVIRLGMIYRNDMDYKIPDTSECLINKTDNNKKTKISDKMKPKKNDRQYINGHEYVDLGLPSCLKWATCNVGANKPEEYGDYYAWGEMSTKFHSNKTCSKQIDDIWSNFQYDAARANWGSTWRLPTKMELEELKNICTWKWTLQNGVEGYKVTGPNGNSIFLPAAGYNNESSLRNIGSRGYYWSSTSRYYNGNAYSLNFGVDGLRVCYCSSRNCRSIRPVSE